MTALQQAAAFAQSKKHVSQTHDPARRTLILSAVGALLGLALAGYALFTAPGTQAQGMPPEDIALVNQRPVLQSDFVTQTQSETGVPFSNTTVQDHQHILTEMIDEELLVQRGLELDLAASDPDVRSALVAGVNLQVDAEILASAPDDAALHAYYEAHKDRYAIDGSMDLRDLVPQQPGPIPPEAVLALRNEANHDKAASRFGLHDSGHLPRGDNYDFGVKAKLGEGLYQAALALAEGQVSDPLRSGGTVHVLVMLKRKPNVQLGFAAARDTVWQDYQREARARVEAQNLAFLRGRAEIRIAPGLAP
jgi:hypothetical protein